jgi:hypothetical protein
MKVRDFGLSENQNDPRRRMLPPISAVALAVAIAAVGPAQSHAANLITLSSFNGIVGSEPLAGLIADTDGSLLGTTNMGGTYGGGTVFEVAKTATGYANNPTTLVDLGGMNGSASTASLIADADGNLFGTTSDFYPGVYEYTVFGTVFEIAKTATGYASSPITLVNFNNTDGAFPSASLIADAHGNLFGTTSEGGAYGPGTTGYGYGTVFEIAKTTTGYASSPITLVSFNGTSGAVPFASLIADAHGDLFGTTSEGGAHGYGPGTCGCGYGTVFEIAKIATGYASSPITLVNFNKTDGVSPLASLIADANGNLFGTTAGGGAYGYGTVFEIAKTATGYANSPKTLVSFNSADGQDPNASLIVDAKGNLFGTTEYGGDYGEEFDLGTIFEVVNTATGYANSPTLLAYFNNYTDGAYPAASLIVDAHGNLFGTTSSGGVYAGNGGTAFEITDSGFAVFAGTPGKRGCDGESVSTLIQQYGRLKAAAAALGYSSVQDLRQAIATYCEG